MCVWLRVVVCALVVCVTSYGCVCIHILLCACVHVRVSTYVCIYTYSCKQIHMQTYTRTNAYVHVYVYVCANMHMCAFILYACVRERVSEWVCTCAYLYSCEVSLCMYICIFVCRYLHACTHKYIHTRDWEGARGSKKHSPGSLLARATRGAARRRGDTRGAEADRDDGVLTCRYRS